jgi:hypothetical protein
MRILKLCVLYMKLFLAMLLTPDENDPNCEWEKDIRRRIKAI